MPLSDSAPALAPGPGRRLLASIRGPYFALVVLFCMNLLNYVDRYVFFSAGPAIMRELKFTDIQFGFLSVSFMVVYTIVSPLMGILGDRYSRRRLLSFGVALWSVATVGTAFARGFNDMFFWRALLGIGEASYGIIAPALLADLFPPKHRGRAMGLYYLALPVGGAIGYGIGGWFAHNTDWRYAFWVVGIPGLAAAVAGLLMHDPGRGASEGKMTGKADRPRLADYLSIFRTPSFVYNTAGQAAVTFALGAYAVWAATFYQRVRGMDGQQAGLTLGALTAVAGLIGIALGTWGADALLKVTRRAYLIWPGLAVAVAVPAIFLAIIDPDRMTSLILLFVASVAMASVLGPSNTVTANVVPANRRAAGYALCIFLVHLFGDISSPLLIGFVSDLFGRPMVAGSSLGTFLSSIGAKVTRLPGGPPTNLTVGMLSVVPMLALGSLLYLRGARHLAADQDRARSEGDDLAVGFVGH